MESRLYEYDKIIKEQKKIIEEYQKLNSLEKYISKMKKNKLKEIRPILFIVKYKDIGLPFQKINVFRIWCNHELYNAKVDQIPDPSIDELYTIVQYEGDGLFTDLTTDKQFKLAHYEEYIKEKLSKDRIKTEKDYNEAISIYNELLRIPLGISDDSRLLNRDLKLVHFGPLHELTPELEMKVVKETIPKKDIIKQSISIKEDIARKKIKEKYGYFYENILYGNMLENSDINTHSAKI